MELQALQRSVELGWRAPTLALGARREPQVEIAGTPSQPLALHKVRYDGVSRAWCVGAWRVHNKRECVRGVN